MSQKILSSSHNQTISLAKRLGKELSKGDVIALVGDLGSGKTTFTKGIAVSLGAKSYSSITSPTFVLIRDHDELKIPLYHNDAYRIKDPLEIELAGFDEYLSKGGVLVIEWADRIKSVLPSSYLKIQFEHVAPNKRLLKFLPRGSHYKVLVNKLKF